MDAVGVGGTVAGSGTFLGDSGLLHSDGGSESDCIDWRLADAATAAFGLLNKLTYFAFRFGGPFVSSLQLGLAGLRGGIFSDAIEMADGATVLNGECGDARGNVRRGGRGCGVSVSER